MIESAHVFPSHSDIRLDVYFFRINSCYTFRPFRRSNVLNKQKSITLVVGPIQQCCSCLLSVRILNTHDSTLETTHINECEFEAIKPIVLSNDETDLRL